MKTDQGAAGSAAAQDQHDHLPETHRQAIARLNDQLRVGLTAGRILLTPGIQSFGEEAVISVLTQIQNFDSFDENNDPYGEHDFGSIQCNGQTIFWKIDYYDQELAAGSPDPADPTRTCRVLTIMLASEY